VAFSFAERLASSRGRVYAFWLMSGAAAMGLGIWSMHFIGMSAIGLPIDVAYHVPTVLLSLALAILASTAALRVVSSNAANVAQTLTGSLLMGAGIATMHYVGMHAMRCTAMHRYNPWLVALSAAIAVGFSWIALRITTFLRSYSGRHRWLRAAGAIAMGLGIAAMHYTAMAAVTFQPGMMQVAPANTMHTSTLGIVAVALTVAIFILGALLTTLRDRKIHEQLLKVHEALEQERDRFHAATESSLDAFFMCSAVRDTKGEIVDFLFTYLNQNVERMVALPIASLLDHRMCDVLPINRTLGLFQRYRQVVLSGEPLAYEFPIRNQDIIASWIRVQAVKVGDGIAITASDITERKEREDHVFHLAHHDPLTGLLNRSLLRDRIGLAIEQARRSRNAAAVFFIDLDGFKHINDTMGHATGDRLLVAVGARLKAAVRSSDSVIRIGGDEFVVVMPGLTTPSDILPCARALLMSLALPLEIDGAAVRISCSIGGVVYPRFAIDTDDLLAKADLALYTAKNLGKNRYHIFSEAEEAFDCIGSDHAAAQPEARTVRTLA
jgi:diguanylate cyclase (GGDEF)-like protein